MTIDTANNLLTFTHPRLIVFGSGLQGSFLNGVLSLEGGYYDSRDDSDGTDPGIENSQIRYLAGYQRAFGENLTLGLQYYGENMLDFGNYVQNLPSAFPEREELRHTLSLRITQLMQYQTLRLSFFTFYSPNDEDYYANPEIRYDLGDGLWVASGSILLGGEKDHTFFGQFEKNDNVYAVLRYAF
jgi:predicted porin